MSRVMSFLVAVVLLAAFGVWAAGQDRRRAATPLDNSAVMHKDILGFVHIRVADLLSTSAGRTALRALVTKNGGEVFNLDDLK